MKRGHFHSTKPILLKHNYSTLQYYIQAIFNINRDYDEILSVITIYSVSFIPLYSNEASVHICGIYDA